MKLGKFKVISQGLALPITLFPEFADKKIGDDVTNELKITYSSQEDIKRKSNGVDPEAKYKAMANRKPNLFKKPLVRKIMRYKFGRKLMFLLLAERKIIRRNFLIGL